MRFQRLRRCKNGRSFPIVLEIDTFKKQIRTCLHPAHNETDSPVAAAGCALGRAAGARPEGARLDRGLFGTSSHSSDVVASEAGRHSGLAAGASAGSKRTF